MKKLYSDGQGTFLQIDKCEDDSNFVNLKIEEEQHDGSYLNTIISLYKDDIKCLAEDLLMFVSELANS